MAGSDEEGINALVQAGVRIVSANEIPGKGVYQLGLSDGSRLKLEEGRVRGADGGLYWSSQFVWEKIDGKKVVLFRT